MSCRVTNIYFFFTLQLRPVQRKTFSTQKDRQTKQSMTTILMLFTLATLDLSVQAVILPELVKLTAHGPERRLAAHVCWLLKSTLH